MTMFQRTFFRRRLEKSSQWQARRDAITQNDELIEALESITTEQWQALMRLGQRVIDGRVQILAKAVGLETAAIHEMRGGVMALQDFLTELEAFSQDAP